MPSILDATQDIGQQNQLGYEDIARVNEWEECLKVVATPVFAELMNRQESTIALFTGNRFGKNSTIAKHYIWRIWGKHPIEAKNMRPTTKSRIIRFCAETLPNDPDREDKNTIYPIFKRMLPASWIKKDITTRSTSMILFDPQGGPDVIIEFVSYNQEVKSQVGVDRFSVWIDESCSKAFFDEQVARTITVPGGDVVISLTPCTAGITWQYDEIFEKADIIVRTPEVVKRWNARFDKKVKPRQIDKARNNSVAVIMAASDDNPYMQTVVDQTNASEVKLIIEGRHSQINDLIDFKPKTVASYLDGKMSIYDRENIDIRRYGIFRQVSGKIFKDFDPEVHVVSSERYFPEGIPVSYCHARGVDYHQHVDWHGGFIALSPDNEAFIYNELKISPEKNVTLDIARILIDKSRSYRYKLTLIDPLAGVTQVNTGMSTIDDLNRIFREFKGENGFQGGYWLPWDTKSTRGREEIRKRLKNAAICGKPFNNTSHEGGVSTKLPTLWIMDTCAVSIDAMNNWRLDEWNDPAQLERKEIKETPLQKYSHMNMVWEAVFKEQSFKAPALTVPPAHKSLYGKSFKS